MNDKPLLIFDRKDFPDKEQALEHFLSHWEETNQVIRDELEKSGLSSFKDLFPNRGAHYRDGRWRVCRVLELIDFTALEPGTQTPGAETLITECPRCRKSAYTYRLPMGSGTAYVHLASIQDGARIEIARCVILPPEKGMIFEASTS